MTYQVTYQMKEDATMMDGARDRDDARADAGLIGKAFTQTNRAEPMVPFTDSGDEMIGRIPNGTPQTPQEIVQKVERAVRCAVQTKDLTDEARLLVEIIQWKRWRLQRAGIEPKRVYMSIKTKQRLEKGIFHGGAVTIVPRGHARVATVCGLDIHEVADLPDGFVDVSGDEEY